MQLHFDLTDVIHFPGGTIPAYRILHVTVGSITPLIVSLGGVYRKEGDDCKYFVLALNGHFKSQRYVNMLCCVYIIHLHNITTQNKCNLLQNR
jgi:hypothetical protein